MPLRILQSGAVLDSFNRSPRLTLQSEARSLEAIPAEIVSAVDSPSIGKLDYWGTGKVSDRTDGVVVWLSGDQLLAGSPAAIRHDLRFPRRAFVPWHLPGVPEMPLIALQPRWSAANHAHDYWNFSVRILSAGKVSQQVHDVLKDIREPWAQLSRALLAEQVTPGAGIEPLLKMWNSRDSIPAIFSSLALRNLVVLCLRQKDVAQAEKLLETGLQIFPSYGEFAFMAALLHYQQNRASRAIPLLEKAKMGDRAFLGCGGESSYRADWLMGLIALRVGNERMAFDHFLRGLLHRRPFKASVEELLQRRWPPRLIAAHQEAFGRAAVYPHLRERIFDFFLQHRAFGAAQGIATSFPFPPEISEQLHERLRVATAPFCSSKTLSSRSGVALAGTFFEHTSLARINRELAASLLSDSQLQVSLEPSVRSSSPAEIFPAGQKLQSALLASLPHLNLTIRHQWPPDFRRPPSGKLAVILPWEYGAVPQAWARAIEENVDELWVPSEFVRSVFRRGGVKTANIEVIPNGFDPEIFRLEGPISRPHGCRRCAFLFVGGAIRRKAIDILLEAYRAAFGPGDNVSLILHLSGLAGSYQHNSLVASVRAMAADPTAPHIQLIADTLNDTAMASLYRGCDALVLPYRGEGFGLPLLEAQACGKPVVTTAEGPAREFCSEKSAYLISAREIAVADDRPPLGRMSAEFTWFEPDMGELIRALRRVRDNSREAADKGRAGAHFVKKNYTWNAVTQLYRARIRKLAGVQTQELREVKG